MGALVSYSAVQWTRSMSLSVLNRMMMTGKHESWSAQRAYELGLVTEVVPHERLMIAARALADKIARNSPTAVRAAKRVLLHAAHAGLDESLENAGKQAKAISSHPDIREGARAFASKRQPQWRGE